MTYYVLPKLNAKMPELNYSFEEVVMMPSMSMYIKDMETRLYEMPNCNEILNVINKYNYLHELMPGSTCAVSSDRSLLFEMLEMNYLMQCELKDKGDLLDFFMSGVLLNKGDNVLMKVSDLFVKLTWDVLYLLTFMFDSVVLIKPVSGNSCKSELYVVCKGFHTSIELKKMDNVKGLCVLPMFFRRKLDDILNIVGKSQLDAMLLALDVKLGDARIEQIQKQNIQKSMAWCVKHGVKYHSWLDKINTFLSLTSLMAV